MLLTLDNELSDLATDLKWADWSAHYTFAVKLDSESEVQSARVLVDEEDILLLNQLQGVRADYWSIGELLMDLLISVAYGFPMSRPTGSHRYVSELLETIRQHEDDLDE